MARKGITTYSERIKGARRNYGWIVGFDLTDGYLGITQIEGKTVRDRVLLSPAQVEALLDFVGGKKTKRAACERTTTPVGRATKATERDRVEIGL